MALRIDAGQGFGALLLLLLVDADRRRPRRRLPVRRHARRATRTRARASRVLVGALAVVPAVAILMLANAPGGIDGQVSKAWKQATDPAVSGAEQQPGAADRDLLGARALLARGAEGPRAGPVARAPARAPTARCGCATASTARSVRHAHGYVVQTLADLGWVGLGAVAARGAARG